MDEKQRILKMIEEGKINATEGLNLLDALDVTDKEPLAVKTVSGKYTKLKVLVDIEEDDVKVDVNIPLQLIKILGNAVGSLDKVLPEEAKEEMEKKGVDIAAIDFDAIFSAIEDGTLEEPDIVNVSINDKDSGKVLVRIYVA